MNISNIELRRGIYGLSKREIAKINLSKVLEQAEIASNLIPLPEEFNRSIWADFSHAVNKDTPYIYLIDSSLKKGKGSTHIVHNGKVIKDGYDPLFSN